MKQQKVKLVKQMREEAENVRIWKQKKEREVSKLKQTERKQQFQVNTGFVSFRKDSYTNPASLLFLQNVLT
jgi:hypothetical protein